MANNGTRSQAEDIIRDLETKILEAAISDRLDDAGSPLTWQERAEKAEADNAAKDAEIAKLIHDLNRIKDHETELVNDNAALTARIKELEDELEYGGRVKGVNTQYANALAYLEMTEDDDPEEFAKRIWDEREALEAKLSAAEKALEPFADIADLIDAETEGMAETDELVLHFHDYEFAKWPVSFFREARAVLGGKPS